MAKVDGALTENQSFLANGSVRFFRPFLPLDNLLFFPTAMIAVVDERKKRCGAVGGVPVLSNLGVGCLESFQSRVGGLAEVTSRGSLVALASDCRSASNLERRQVCFNHFLSPSRAQIFCCVSTPPELIHNSITHSSCLSRKHFGRRRRSRGKQARPWASRADSDAK